MKEKRIGAGSRENIWKFIKVPIIVTPLCMLIALIHKITPF